MKTSYQTNIEQDAITVIKSINTITSRYWIISKVSKIFWLSSEIICYLIFIGLIIFAIVLPNGEIYWSQVLSPEITVDNSVKIKMLVEFFAILKTTIIILGFLMFIPAIIFRKIRKKNNTFYEINKITNDFLKKDNI